MQLRDIALKNLQRRKSKMLFLAFGMIFGIATIISLFTLTDAMEASVASKVRESGTKLTVVPKTETATFSVGGIPVVSGVSFNQKDLSADVLNKIKTVSNADKIKVVAPKLMGPILVNNTKVLVVGVDFPHELKIKSWWEVQGKKPDQDDQALLGLKVAESLKVTTGQELTINGKVLKVAGVLKETGEAEDGILFVDLKTARKLLNKPVSYSFVELITVKDDLIAAGIAKELSQAIPEARVNIVKQAEEARQELVQRFASFSLVVSLVMIFITALIISSTMMGSVNERTREIGVLRAMGFRAAHVKKIILTEASLISGFSGFVGYFLGMGIAYLIAPFYSGFKLVITWNLLLGLGVVVGAVIIGILASLYPASKAANLDPVEALRFI